MSKINLTPNASGTGVFTIASPNSNTDRTLTLPDKAGTVNVGEGIDDNATSTAVTIDASGKVGIGTTSPETALDVSGSIIASSAYRLRDSGGNDRNILQMSGDDPVFQTGTSSGSRSLLFETEGLERMRVDASGKVGIGTTNPQAQIHVAGGIRFSSSGADANRWNVYWNGSTGDLIVVSSDERLKKDFNYDIAGIETVNKLKPVRFTWKDNNKRQLGFTAQESFEADEHLAWHNTESDQWGLDGWEGYAAVLTKAIQEQQAIIDSQASAIADLTTRLEAVEAN